MAKKRKFKYGIFDKDGVLTDSAKIHYEHFVALAQRHFGVAGVSLSEFHSLVGTNWDESLALYGDDLTVRQKFMADYDAEIGSKLKQAQIFTGVISIIEMLKQKGLSLLISSSAPQDTVDLFLEQSKLGHYFEAAIGNPGRPLSKAEHFKTFAQRFEEVDNQNFFNQTFIIEDMAHGIKMAKDFGLFAIGLETSLTGAELKAAGADVVLPNHAALLEYVRNSL